METPLQKGEKYNQEEEGFNPLLRLGSSIPTPTLTDQESPIMFNDSCSGSKKTILIDPSSMKEASSTTDDDERSHSRLSSSPSSSSSSFFHQIPNSSPPLCRYVSDMSSFAISGSFSSPKSPENADDSVHKSDDQNLVEREGFDSVKKLSMETLFTKEATNEEEGFSPTDQKSPIDSCSTGGSKKRSFLTSTFGERKKKIFIDPSSMKEASDMSSFALSGSFSSPKSPENAAAAAIPNQKSCPSNARHFGRSSSFPSCLKSTLPENSPFSSPKSPENAAAAISNQKSCPSNARHFGRSSSFSSCLKSTLPENSPQKSNPSNSSYFGKSSSFSRPSSSSSPSFHLPKSPTATPIDSVQKSDDQKPIGDQKDCSSGNCKFGVLAATATAATETAAPATAAPAIAIAIATEHPMHQQIVQTNLNRINALSCDLLNCVISYLPVQDRAKIPTLSKTLLASFARDPKYIDPSIIRSWNPLSLEIDCERLDRCLTFCWLSYKGKKERLIWFMKSLLREHRNVHELYLVGTGIASKCVMSRQFAFLKCIHCFKVRISSVEDMVALSGCLEQLELKKCIVPSYFELKLGDKANFKILLMEMCAGLMDENLTHIIIKVPTLLKFKFHGCLTLIDLFGLKELAEANIKFICIPSTPHLLRTTNDIIFGVLNSLQNVQTLRICSICLQNARDSSRRSRLLFPELKHLCLSVSLEENDEVKDLSNLLMSAPLLSQLFIQVDHWFVGSGLWRKNPIRMDHLTYFRMEPFKCGSVELEFIAEVLMKSKLLKKAEIILLYGIKCSSMNDHAQQKLMKAFEDSNRMAESILALPKASPEAEIIVIIEDGFKV